MTLVHIVLTICTGGLWLVVLLFIRLGQIAKNTKKGGRN